MYVCVCERERERERERKWMRLWGKMIPEIILELKTRLLKLKVQSKDLSG